MGGHSKKKTIFRFISFYLLTFVGIFYLMGCSANQSGVQKDTVKEYVVNKRTRKIHSTECPSVGQMSEKNKLLVSDTLLDLLKQDNVICRRCRAGVHHDGVDDTWNHLMYSNLYGDEVQITASYEDYLEAIDEMSEWYVDHVPTYASKIETEEYSLYSGEDDHYKEYSFRNRGKTKTYKVISSDSTAESVSTLTPDTLIIRGSENAAKNYSENYKQIKFERKIAYYPCDLLTEESDYNTPGDDCVRYLFAIFNMMDSQFTKKYADLTNSSYSKTDSSTIATDYRDIAYGFINLGFKIYDMREGLIDVDGDDEAEGYVFALERDFQLRKGDILAKEGHVHIYLGDGMIVSAENFGWGRVYRTFPAIYEIKPNVINGSNCISVKGSDGKEDPYRRVYRYVGENGGVAR